MLVAQPVDGRARWLAVWFTEIGAPLLAAGILVLGHLDVLPPYPAVAVAVGLVAALAASRLVRLAIRLHRTQRGFGPCRGAGFLGFGILASGIGAVVLPLCPAGSRNAVALGGLVPALALYLLGMLMLPGAAGTVAVRLRRGFDGLSLGISLTFSAWVIPPPGGMPPLAFVATALAIVTLPIITITTLRAYDHRRSAALCGFGAGTAIFGHTLVTVLADYHIPAEAIPLAAIPLVVGPATIAAGARRANPVARSTPALAEPHAKLSAYPVLTIPALLATISALYHLVTVGTFDRTSILLGLAVIPTLVVREVLIMLDIRRYARRLADQEAHFRSLVSGANDLTLIVGEDLLIRWQSPAAARLFGLADAEVVGRAFPDLMHPDDAAEVTAVLTAVIAGTEAPASRPALVTARLRDGHGVWRDTESTISDQRGVPEVAALVVHVRDVSERNRLERTLHELTFTDQLTGLANRRELMRAILTQRTVPAHPGALLVIDLHGMSAINDARGRQFGDAVLTEVGRRLKAAVGGDDVVARLGGDEFAVLTVDRPVLAYAMGTRLLTVLTEPYQMPGALVHLGASIGLADLSGGDSVDDVLRRADLARARARQLGRNRVEWYDDQLEEQFVRRLDLERELPGAAQRGELDLVYQPVLDLDDEQPVGMEALLRWRSPTLGTVLPAELLPVAEDLRLVEELGRWVLDTACRQIVAWSPRPRPLWMAVNISCRELAAPDFVRWVTEALAAHRVPPERLVLEIAEPRGSVQIPTVVTRLAELRAVGVRIALDDFGTGPSSLAQLRRLPVDFLKVDRRLVLDRPSRDGERKPFIDVVVSLGRRFDLEIIAEGLESPTQVAQARAAGCRLGQGYALSRPAPAERVEAFLEEFPSTSR
ncbi:bifunctional diguanylate cyclase/phosphodiesterase [Micromonospora sp. HM5-17]|uniref:putative bifunctional diguanylate cyclase/phosphodiesterase n=1 Tax=Micromonospora sp. HM5-17 TaxID=2487710 RepID=UPI000F46AEFA|nr:GGDEF domain-containing phosphodiesterase [Micromonospora sp. HM5-17]ROT32514.1 phosphodiesterase [Micromonospora sp. HM5-17]